jgi:hypothetical protein
MIGLHVISSNSNNRLKIYTKYVRYPGSSENASQEEVMLDMFKIKRTKSAHQRA